MAKIKDNAIHIAIERDAPRQGGDSDTHGDEGNAQQHDPTDKSAEYYPSLATTRCSASLSSQFTPRGDQELVRQTGDHPARAQ